MGAGLPANTGKARAIHRGVFFAGNPLPQGSRCDLRHVFMAA
ncbi:diguanylate cyclase, partial [Pseudomonas plecoglossicida]